MSPATRWQNGMPAPNCCTLLPASLACACDPRPAVCRLGGVACPGARRSRISVIRETRRRAAGSSLPDRRNHGSGIWHGRVDQATDGAWLLRSAHCRAPRRKNESEDPGGVCPSGLAVVTGPLRKNRKSEVLLLLLLLMLLLLLLLLFMRFSLA